MGSGINFTPAFNSAVGATEILTSLKTAVNGNVFIPLFPATLNILPVFIPGGTQQAAIKWNLFLDQTAGNGGLDIRIVTSNAGLAPFDIPFKVWRQLPSIFVAGSLLISPAAFTNVITAINTTGFVEIECTTENVPAPGLTLSIQIRENIFDPNPGSFSKGSYSRLTLLK